MTASKFSEQMSFEEFTEKFVELWNKIESTQKTTKERVLSNKRIGEIFKSNHVNLRFSPYTNVQTVEDVVDLLFGEALAESC